MNNAEWKLETAAKEQKARRRATWAKSVMPFGLLVVLVVVFSIGNSHFLSAENLWNILRQSSVLLVISVGATFVILQGSIDLSVGSVATLSGLISTTLVYNHGFSSWAAFIVGVLIGSAAGFVSGTIFAYGKVPSFLATLGMLSVLQGAGLIITRGMPIPISNSGFLWVSQGNLLGPVPNIGLWALLVFGLGTYACFRMKFGRYMFAIGGGERVAKLAGVKVNRYKLYAFVVSGALAGLAGILLASRVGSGTPDGGASYLLDSIAAVVMGGTALSGGVGGVHRTLLGVAIIGVLRNGMNIMGVDPYVQIAITGIVVIAAVAMTLDRSKITIMK